jgi:hypothetical protein
MTQSHRQQTGSELAVSWQIRDELRLKVLQMYPPPAHVFAVVSWGSAGTKWLSNVLNSHPDIFCVHGARILWSHVAGRQDLGDLDYLRLIGMLGSGCLAAGEVHGIRREGIAGLKQRLGEQFRAIVVVRDPVPRLLSFVSLGRYFSFSPWEDLAYLRGLEGFRRVLHVITDRQREYFAHGVNLLNVVIAEDKIAPIFRMEDFTAKPNALRELFCEVTGGAVSIDLDQAAQMITRSPSNAHARREGGPSEGLEAWQKEILRAMLLEEAKTIYERLGYTDLVF